MVENHTWKLDSNIGLPCVFVWLLPMDVRKFTREELSRYNGKDGAPVFVAFEGIVYDLSTSFLWRGGRH